MRSLAVTPRRRSSSLSSVSELFPVPGSARRASGSARRASGSARADEQSERNVAFATQESLDRAKASALKARGNLDRAVKAFAAVDAVEGDLGCK